jgi:fucose permease
VALGLPDGMLGTAWPSIRHTFGAPVGELGLILLVATAGSGLVTAVVGALLRRVGVAALLAVAGSCGALGAAGFALAPGLWLVVGVSVLIGAGAGMMDGGLNTAVALSGRPRLLNLLHGAYGVGTALGPLLVTAAILAGSWRAGYAALVVVEVVTAGAWLHHRRADRPRPRPVEAVEAVGVLEAVGVVEAVEAGDADPGRAWTRRHYVAVVAAGLAVFFVYTGLEVGAGQWEASFCRGHLGMSTTAAGLATFGYWAALTVARVGLAVWPHPVAPPTVIRLGSAVAVVAAATIWWQPDPVVAVTGFVILGGALAGVFPALVALTPVRIGARRARDAIAWQVGAAAAGGAGISAVIGLLIGASSLAVLGPSITVLAVLLVGAELILNRVAPVR